MLWSVRKQPSWSPFTEVMLASFHSSKCKQVSSQRSPPYYKLSHKRWTISASQSFQNLIAALLRTRTAISHNDSTAPSSIQGDANGCAHL